MRSEDEVKQKLDYYRGMLDGLRHGRMIDSPEVFLRISQYFPEEAMKILGGSVAIDEMIEDVPSEDRGWVKKWLSWHFDLLELLLETRINMLRWVLEMEPEGSLGDSDRSR